MGIVNVTPDSFSDGGLFSSTDAAIAHGRALAADGADVVDIGGESTRPGAEIISRDQELARVIPVVEALAAEIRVSIDTRHEHVAREAVRAGATIINDVSASLGNLAGELGVGWVAMHMLGDPKTMQQNPTYDDVVAEVLDFLVERADAAAAAGVREIWIDPGIGFGKTTAHNLELVARLDAFVNSGYPVLFGASRKRFLGELTADSDGIEGVTDATDRREAGATMTTWAFMQGVAMVRAHDVRTARQSLQVVGVGI
jgi:dihydropteroate synthase